MLVVSGEGAVMRFRARRGRFGRGRRVFRGRRVRRRRGAGGRRLRLGFRM